MKKVLLLTFLLPFLFGCSSESGGRGKISMKINGVLYEYTDVSVGYEHVWELNEDEGDILYIRGEDDDNTYEHREAFVFRPYRGRTYNNQILIASRIINDGVSYENSWSGNQDDFDCIFYQNDKHGFKGTFEGQLHDGAEILNVTEGTIEISYGDDNYGYTGEFGKK